MTLFSVTSGDVGSGIAPLCKYLIFFKGYTISLSMKLKGKKVTKFLNIFQFFGRIYKVRNQEQYPEKDTINRTGKFASIFWCKGFLKSGRQILLNPFEVLWGFLFKHLLSTVFCVSF